MNDFKVNLENLTDEEKAQLLKLIEKANKSSKIWKPELGERYYYVLYHPVYPVYPDVIVPCGWKDDLIDNYRHSMGNCFKTKEKAEFAQERQKVLVELERFAKEHNEDFDKWYHLLCCTLYPGNPNRGEEDEYEFSTYKLGNRVSGVTFSSDEIAMAAVEAIGKERLLKYYFEVK